jgi:hypothetical protein
VTGARSGPTPAARAPRDGEQRSGLITFDRLKWGSFAHSAIYLALLLNWLVLDLDGPRPWLGFAHGVGWIAMSLAAVTALRMRVIDLRLAVAVAVLGGIGPFFGSAEFVRRGRTRSRARVQGAWP